MSKEPTVSVWYIKDGVSPEAALNNWSGETHERKLKCPTIEMASPIWDLPGQACDALEMCSSYLWMSRHGRALQDGDLLEVEGAAWMFMAAERCAKLPAAAVEWKCLPQLSPVVLVRASCAERIDVSG